LIKKVKIKWDHLIFESMFIVKIFFVIFWLVTMFLLFLNNE